MTRSRSESKGLEFGVTGSGRAGATEDTLAPARPAELQSATPLSFGGVANGPLSQRNGAAAGFDAEITPATADGARDLPLAEFSADGNGQIGADRTIVGGQMHLSGEPGWGGERDAAIGALDVGGQLRWTCVGAVDIDASAARIGSQIADRDPAGIDTAVGGRKVYRVGRSIGQVDAAATGAELDRLSAQRVSRDGTIGCSGVAPSESRIGNRDLATAGLDGQVTIGEPFARDGPVGTAEIG